MPFSINCQWANAVQTRSARHHHVLLALAILADGQSTCSPSQAVLARITHRSVRFVRNTLTDLERDGWIERTPRYWPDHGRMSDLIRLRIDKPPGRARPLEFIVCPARSA